MSLTENIAHWLTGRKSTNQWLFDPTEIARAADARTVPRVVVAYDFTLSVEKSISLAWVHANTQQRAVIEPSLEELLGLFAVERNVLGRHGDNEQIGVSRHDDLLNLHCLALLLSRFI